MEKTLSMSGTAAFFAERMKTEAGRLDEVVAGLEVTHK